MRACIAKCAQLFVCRFYPFKPLINYSFNSPSLYSFIHSFIYSFVHFVFLSFALFFFAESNIYLYFKSTSFTHLCISLLIYSTVSSTHVVIFCLFIRSSFVLSLIPSLIFNTFGYSFSRLFSHSLAHSISVCMTSERVLSRNREYRKRENAAET